MTQEKAMIAVENFSALNLMPTLAIDQNPAVVYLASLTSSTSRRTMQNALNTITDILNPALKIRLPKTEVNSRYQLIAWAMLRHQHTMAIRARLSESYKPATVNKILAALRGVLEAAFNLQQINADKFQRASKVKNLKNETLPVGRDLHDDEMLKLLQVCKADKNEIMGIRDSAIFIVLWRCSLRRQELVNLDLADYDPNSRRLIIRSGKGRKDRATYIPAKALTLFQRWLNIRGEAEGALFLPILKSSEIIHKRQDQSARLSTQAVYNMLKERGNEAAIADFSPHDMRRTLIGDLLDKGVDVMTVSKVVGHSSPTITGKYDRRPERTKRDAVDMLDVPDIWFD